MLIGPRWLPAMPDSSPPHQTQSLEDSFTEEWDSKDGRERSGLLMQLALRGLPEAERLYLVSANPTVLDWGYGRAEGAVAISRAFNGRRLSELSFAAASKERPDTEDPDFAFLSTPHGQIPREFDIIVVSGRL